MQQVEREERDRSARSPPSSRAFQRRRHRRDRRHRPRPARRRASPIARRPARPCRPARGVPRSGRPRPHRRPARRRRPAASAGPIEDECPDATPPRLEQVLLRVERLGQRPRQHRPQVRQVRESIGGRIERERELVGHRGPMVDLAATGGHRAAPVATAGPRAARPCPPPSVAAAAAARRPSDRLPRPPFRRSRPCRVRPAPTTCIACASRPNRPSRPTAAGPSSRCRPWRPASTSYRHALWLVPTDAAADGEPRQLTIGARHDRHARFSPDGRTLAFLSDRRAQVEEEPERRTTDEGARGPGPGPRPAARPARARRAG